MHDSPSLPLDDIRVLEIGYGIAAPVCARTLGQFGADAIRVESVRRPDSLRTAGAGWVPLSVPWEIRRDTGTGINGFTGPEKRSVSLELDTEPGMSAFRALVANSDVLVMNMSYDAVASLGLGYEDLQPLNPGLIYLNLFAFGSEGPYRSFRTWGGNLSGLAGVAAQVGWPDRPPSGLPLSFPDYPSSMWGVVAVVAALLRRDETGVGCELDLSQFQVAIETVAPTVAEAVLSGATPPRGGARVRGRAPDGIFPTSEPDRYVVVSVPDDQAWRRLGHVEGLEDLAADPALDAAAERQVAADEVAARLAEWTSTLPAWESTWRLQEAGVAAFPVLDPLEVLRDDHLGARGFFHALPHARFEAELCYGQAVRLTDTPALAKRAGPAFGEHTREVLADVAGLSGAEIEALLEAGDAQEMTHTDVKLERPFYGWIGAVTRLNWPPATADSSEVLFARLEHEWGDKS